MRGHQTSRGGARMAARATLLTALATCSFVSRADAASHRRQLGAASAPSAGTARCAAAGAGATAVANASSNVAAGTCSFEKTLPGSGVRLGGNTGYQLSAANGSLINLFLLTAADMELALGINARPLACLLPLPVLGLRGTQGVAAARAAAEAARVFNVPQATLNGCQLSDGLTVDYSLMVKFPKAIWALAQSAVAAAHGVDATTTGQLRNLSKGAFSKVQDMYKKAGAQSKYEAQWRQVNSNFDSCIKDNGMFDTGASSSIAQQARPVPSPDPHAGGMNGAPWGAAGRRTAGVSRGR